MSLFQCGEYSTHQALQTGWVIAAAGLGLVPFAISQLQIFAFYAMPDTKTPALVNIPVVALRLVLAPGFPRPAGRRRVAAGLMVGNAPSSCSAAVWVLAAAAPARPAGADPVGLTLAAAGRRRGVAALPAWLLVYLLDRLMSDSWLSSVIQLVVGGLVLLVAYVGAAVLLRVREVSEVAGMVRGRLGR